jgi:hypothetical protein
MVSDSAKVELLLLEVSSHLNEAVTRREECKALLLQDDLLEYHDWLASNLQLEEKNGCLTKLLEAIEKCEAVRQLQDVIKAAALVKTKLEKDVE